MSIITSPLLLGADSGIYQISRSLRFNSADSAYLSRTPASAGNRKTWTWAGWVKGVATSENPHLFTCTTGATDATYFRLWFVSDSIRVSNYNNNLRQTSAVYRDPSAWYHVVLAVDTTQATAANRIKLYVNGSEVTAFSSSVNPNQNDDLGINQAAAHSIGATSAGTATLSGYLADIHFIDGQALDPSSFTETDATTGQLIPKAYSGGSYGTNGFKLNFSDNSTTAALGTDTSGNGNTWTVNNFSVSSGAAVSVAAATGALPVFNTTDTYGTVKGTGTRTDTNSSSIVLALPMDGTNGGTSFGDQSAVIKGSGSAKTINVNGNTNTSTSQSKFYGSSGYFDGSGDFLTSTSADFGFSSGTAFTIECWFRAAGLPSSGDGSGGAIFGNRGFVESNAFTVYLGSSSTNTIGVHVGGGTTTYFSRSGGFALNTWYHLAMVRNTSNTVEFYVNGVSIGTGSVTSDLSNGAMYIAAWNSTSAFNGYIQDLRIYKGAAKYTGNFNPPSATADPAVGAGNDSLVDTPTSFGTDTGVGGEVRGNYCTWNPLAALSFATLSNGNLDVALNGSASYAIGVRGTIAIPTSGKWYWEVTVTSVGELGIGVIDFQSGIRSYYYRYDDGGWQNIYINDVQTAAVVGYTNNDVIGIGYDADNSQIRWYKNGTQVGTNYSLTNNGRFVPHISHGSFSGSAAAIANFGQRAFAYTAPSGFKALCDTNLPAPLTAKPDQVFQTKLYTGNASTNTISGLGFSPDLVWIKSRSNANWHNIIDAVRGNNKIIYSNSTDAEASEGTPSLTSFNSDGFTLSGNGSTGVGNVNGNGTTYVAWNWDAGTSTVTNTAGSITSQVRANASAGFSVVTYTATGSTLTVGHGLGVAPELIIIKGRTSTNSWAVYTKVVGTSGFLLLNSTAAVQNYNVWNNTSPTSTVFTVGAPFDEGNASGVNHVAYCFAPVVGYSSFGSYVGNGSSSDGPFVYTGHKPRWLMIKCSSIGDAYQHWHIFDTARSGYNVTSAVLQANTSTGEGSFAVIDLLSNGFKIKYTDSFFNQSGSTWIFASFAENPFQYARAR
jgi:hypothetical protein